jgi:hypothetical protein
MRLIHFGSETEDKNSKRVANEGKEKEAQGKGKEGTTTVKVMANEVKLAQERKKVTRFLVQCVY